MALGIKEADARLWLKEIGGEVEEVFAIWACNAEAWSFWLDLEPCWVMPPMGGKPLRIDRGEMESTARLLGLPKRDWRAMFRKMQMMEREVQAVWKGR